jgi:predicted small secreted protein
MQLVMTNMTRRAAIAAVCLLALSLSACSNNSGGKVVGKWKVVGGSKQSDMAAMNAMGMALYFEFTSDSKFTMGVMSTKPDGGVMNLGADTTMSGTYSLGMGDTVNFSATSGSKGKEKLTTNFKRNGDKAQMKDPDGTTLDLELVK